jgi:hypothetical protein
MCTAGYQDIPEESRCDYALVLCISYCVVARYEIFGLLHSRKQSRKGGGNDETRKKRARNGTSTRACGLHVVENHKQHHYDVGMASPCFKSHSSIEHLEEAESKGL